MAKNLDNLKKEFQYYLDHQDELVKKYNGKYLVIKDASVNSAFDTVSDAYEYISAQGFIGKAIIQKCSPGSDDYTMTFHSRVRFSSC